MYGRADMITHVQTLKARCVFESDYKIKQKNEQMKVIKYSERRIQMPYLGSDTE